MWVEEMQETKIDIKRSTLNRVSYLSVGITELVIALGAA